MCYTDSKHSSIFLVRIDRCSSTEGLKKETTTKKQGRKISQNNWKKIITLYGKCVKEKQHWKGISKCNLTWERERERGEIGRDDEEKKL